MALKAKIPLIMNNDVKVRTISELKENFDVERVLGYFIDGKLQQWLEDRYYEEEAEAVEKLDKDDADIAEKICGIFDVEYVNEGIDIDVIAIKNERIAKLKQFTSDDEIIENVDLVAFDQEDLASLFDEGVEKIYLCEGTFHIPKSKIDLEYKIIGNVTVNNELVNTENNSTTDGGGSLHGGKIDIGTACNLFKTYHLQEAFEQFEILANNKNDTMAMFYLSEYYRHGYGNVCKNIDEGKRFRNLSAESGNVLAQLNLAFDLPSNSDERSHIINSTYLDVLEMAEQGEFYAQYEIGCVFAGKKEWDKAFKWLLRSAEQNFWKASTSVAEYYYIGCSTDKDIEKAIAFLKCSADQGYECAIYRLGEILLEMGRTSEGLAWLEKGIEKDDPESKNLYAQKMKQDNAGETGEIFRLFRSASEQNNINAKINVALCYYEGYYVIKDVELAKQSLLKLANEGIVDAMYHLGRICFEIYEEKYDRVAERIAQNWNTLRIG